MVVVPLACGVHLYHTDFPPALPAWLGSPASLVAFTLVPVAVAFAPVSVCELANASLAGLEIGSPAASAMLILGLVTPPVTRVSVTGVPVLCRDERRLLTEAVGVFCLRSAHAPATCGAAMEVPVK